MKRLGVLGDGLNGRGARERMAQVRALRCAWGLVGKGQKRRHDVDVVGDFRLEKLIGRGGMATVYRGTQISLDRPVAVKVLASQLAKKAHFVQRFQREAKVLAQLSHHNIVNVLAVGSHEDTNYLVMEYVEGESLRARLTRDGSVPFAEAVGLIDGVAAGLEYVLQGYNLREAAFFGGYGPLIFHEREWKIQGPKNKGNARAIPGDRDRRKAAAKAKAEED